MKGVKKDDVWPYWWCCACFFWVHSLTYYSPTPPRDDGFQVKYADQSGCWFPTCIGKQKNVSQFHTAASVQQQQQPSLILLCERARWKSRGCESCSPKKKSWRGTSSCITSFTSSTFPWKSRGICEMEKKLQAVGAFNALCVCAAWGNHR